jgi:hypothetical protein
MIFLSVLCLTPINGLGQEMAIERIYDASHTLTDTARYAYALKNVGSSTLYVENVRPSCNSCTSLNLNQKTIKVGEQAVLSVVLDSLRVKAGKSASIFVSSNDRFEPVRHISIDPKQAMGFSVLPERLVLSYETAASRTSTVFLVAKCLTNVFLGPTISRSLNPYVNISEISGDVGSNLSVRTRAFRVWLEPNLRADVAVVSDIYFEGTIGNTPFTFRLPVAVGHKREVLSPAGGGCVSCRRQATSGLLYAPSKVMMSTSSKTQTERSSLLRVTITDPAGASMLEVSGMNRHIVVSPRAKTHLAMGEYQDFEILRDREGVSFSDSPAYVRISAVLGRHRFVQIVPVIER